MVQKRIASHPFQESILLATHNHNKVREISEILGADFHVLGLDAIPEVPEIKESGDTFETNACLKAGAISEFFSGWVLADDSGLAVDALDGAPGVFSARFAGEEATDGENRALLLKRLEEKQKGHRTARFHCVLALAKEGKIKWMVSGVVEGTIAEAERGNGGFGYDSLFVPAGYSKTFAELSPEVKNQISHRALALKEFHQRWLTEHMDS